MALARPIESHSESHARSYQIGPRTCAARSPEDRSPGTRPDRPVDSMGAAAAARSRDPDRRGPWPRPDGCAAGVGLLWRPRQGLGISPARGDRAGRHDLLEEAHRVAQDRVIVARVPELGGIDLKQVALGILLGEQERAPGVQRRPSRSRHGRARTTGADSASASASHRATTPPSGPNVG